MTLQPSVEQLIQDRKRQHQTQQKRRWILRGLFLGWIMVLGLGTYGYIISTFSRSGSVVWSGEYFVTPSELRLAAGLASTSWTALTDPVALRDSVAQHPLVASVSIQRKPGNALSVTLVEHRLMGLVMSPEGQKYVTEQGALITLTPQLVDKNLALPLIYDFTVAEHLTRLADELAQLDDEIFVNISEIHIDHMAFDQPVLTLHMQDGNRVYVAISALFRLSDYMRVIQNTGLTNACFELIERGDAVPVISCPQD